MQSIIDFFTNNWTAIATALFLVSEALSFIPAVKANGVFQLIFGWLSKFAPKS